MNTNKQKIVSALVAIPLTLFSVTACTQSNSAAPTADQPAAAQVQSQPAAANITSAKLNVNSATIEELMAGVPGLGEKMADEFEEYRPFVSIQQFRQEMGKYVDEATIAGYEEHIFIPIDMNEADAATLMQVPGIDQAAAEEIIAKRPFDTVKFFLGEVAEYAPEADLEIAQSYLANAEQATANPAASAPTISAKLNVNTATAEELMAGVPGLGEKMADEFMEYRPFVSIQQFRQEMGKYVDDATIAEYEEYIFVPIDMNQSDAATLMQVPGIDQTAADEIIAKRPFDTTKFFLGEVAEYAPDANLELATAYMVTE
ncbi:MAG: helix-hairpin-helix domain-containing protein [Caldilineaceae bacterium]